MNLHEKIEALDTETAKAILERFRAENPDLNVRVPRSEIARKDELRAVADAVGAEEFLRVIAEESDEVEVLDVETLYENVRKMVAEGVKTETGDLRDNMRKLLLRANEMMHAADVRATVESIVKSMPAGRGGPLKIQVHDRAEVREIKNKVLPAWFQDLVDLSSQRRNVALVGPTGCGKTHVAEMLAEVLGLPFASISCSAGMSESVFTGWLLPTGEGGAFVHVPADFVRIYEDGGVFLFDEMDAADENLLTFVNKALANGSFYVPQRIGNTLVKKHADFIAVAAMNTYGNGPDAQYVGRNPLDGATVDRFWLLYVDYDDAVEESLCLPEVLRWGRELRAKVRGARLRRNVSTRKLADASVMVKGAGWSMEKVERFFFTGWTRDELAAVRGRVPDHLEGVVAK